MLRLIASMTGLALFLASCGGGGQGGVSGGTVGGAVGGGAPSAYGVGGTASVGRFVFVANPGSGTISEFLIDPISGALASGGPPVVVGRRPTAIAGTIDRKYLYVSNGDSSDVSAFSIDPNSGALTPVPGSPFATGANPMAVAVYTASFSSSKGGGAGPPSYRSYLNVASAGSDAVAVYQIDQITGALTPLSAPYATGNGPSAMASRPDGEFLYVANSGGSYDISAFSIDGYYGSLRPVLGSPFSSGGSVSSLAFGAGEVFLYAAKASGSTASILGFRIHPFSTDVNSGALTALPGSPYDLPSCNDIVADQTGTLLYATAGTNVFGFSIDQQTGALALLPGFPVVVGDTADSMSIDATNQFLYVTNLGAGKVAGFRRDAATGELTTMQGSPFSLGH